MKARLDVLSALTIPNPEYEERIKKRRPTWGIDAKIKLYTEDQGDLIAPRGCLDELMAVIRPHNLLVILEDLTNTGVYTEFTWNKAIVLKEDQVPFVNALYKFTNGIGVAPAGSGKTVMGMKLIHGKGHVTLWLTHTADLMHQTKERAEMCLSNVGRIGMLGDGMKDLGDGKLIIAMAQYLQANQNLIATLNPLIGTLVIDECHHFPSPLFAEIVGKFAARDIIGLTATPDRKDKLERLMTAGIGPIRYEIKRDGMYDTGRLIKPDIRFIYTDFDFDTASVMSEAGSVDAGGEDVNYHEYIDALTSDKGRLELISDNIVKTFKGNYSLVVAENVRYCFMIRDAILKASGSHKPKIAVVHGGISRYTWKVAKSNQAAEYLACEFGTEFKYDKSARRWKVKVPQYSDSEFEEWQVSPKERKAAIEAMRNRELEILICTSLAKEGLDISHLNILHAPLPMKGDSGSRRDGSGLEQTIGRIQRPDPSNPDKKAVIYDYVDYNVGIFKQQYYSRRKVYSRLGFKVPAKPKSENQDIETFLANMKFD